MSIQKKINMKVTRPIMVSGAFEVVKLVTAVLFYSLLARNVSPAMFGGYVLIRKIAAWFCPVASFGTYVGLSYYLPAAQGERRKAEIISASTVLVATVLLLLSAVFVLFPDETLNLFFGEEKAGTWLGPLIVMIFVDALYQYILAVKRGNLNITAVNIYKIIIVGLIPLAVILLYPGADLRRLVFIIAAASLVVLLVPIVEIYVRWISKVSIAGVVAGLRAIWKYHLFRIPGDLLFMTFIGCWLVIAAHLYDYSSVGYVSVGLNMIGALGVITVPFETVLLPVTRRLESVGTKALSSDLVHNVLQCSVHIALYVALHVAVLAPFIIRWWLGGGEYVNAAECVRLMSPMLFGYILYVGNRHMVDGISTRPMNSYLVAAAIALSLTLFSLGYYVFGITSLGWLCISCSIGFMLLGLSLTYILMRHYNISFKRRNLATSIIYSVASAAVILLVRKIEINPYGSFVIVSASEMLMFILYVVVLAKNRSVWALKILGYLTTLANRVNVFRLKGRVSSSVVTDK